MTAAQETRAYICKACQRFVGDSEGSAHLCMTPDFLLGVVVAMLPSRNSFYALTAIRSGLDVKHLDDRQFNDGMDYGFSIASTEAWQRNVYECLPEIVARSEKRLNVRDATDIINSEEGQRLLQEARRSGRAAGVAFERDRLARWESTQRSHMAERKDAIRSKASHGMFRKLMMLEPDALLSLRENYLARDEAARYDLYRKFRASKSSKNEQGTK